MRAKQSLSPSPIYLPLIAWPGSPSISGSSLANWAWMRRCWRRDLTSSGSGIFCARGQLERLGHDPKLAPRCECRGAFSYRTRARGCGFGWWSLLHDTA